MDGRRDEQTKGKSVWVLVKEKVGISMRNTRKPGVCWPIPATYQPHDLRISAYTGHNYLGVR